MEENHRRDSSLAAAAVYANSFRTVKPFIARTGMWTHSLRQDALRHMTSARVAETFLVNSRLCRRDTDLEASVAPYFSESGAFMLSLTGREGLRGQKTVVLPESKHLRMGMGDIVRARRSVREYSGDEMPLGDLGTIARAAAGVTGYRTSAGGNRIALRSVPSGGGVYPVDLHIVALRVTNLVSGAYVYQAREDLLSNYMGKPGVDKLLDAMAVADQSIMLSRACAIFLLLGRPWRSMRKYGARGMRLVFLEAGAMAEHINLAATALGYGSVDCSAYYDDEANEALCVDGVYEALIHTVVVGVPS